MSNRFLKTASPCEIVRKLVVKAVLDYRLIEAGDKILLAVSGGKDSTSLAYALSAAKNEIEAMIGGSFSLHALHISTDFCSCCKKTPLRLQLQTWGIDFADIFVPVIGRLKPGREMNCYWCSTQRRSELLKYAVEHGFSKIALGHHLDDIIETYFMNLLEKGKAEGMPVKLAYKKYPVSLIRPLALLEEREIIDCAKELDILAAACTCPYGVNSGRKKMRQKIAAFTNNDGAVKRRIFAAISSLP
ncbi:MAG: tRNA 2-thiocytidine biosynthesis TtcA family protein [Spirochaetaceae bacterium]|jgi:tRNA 2-thiocytidine biosynthesis protein TtcA|nr:tRNA 2-thiocytidine biosynthesis TtcA family protein [Spirochaetaceae bacterium]